MIYVVGIGPGDASYLTLAAEEVIGASDILVGAKRNLECITNFSGERIELGSNLKELREFLQQNKEKKVSVLASGDPLIYGIGKYLSEHFSKEELTIVPGISAVQYMFSKIPLDMNDVYITSSHGKTPDFDRLLSFSKVAMVTDTLVGPKQIAEEIVKRGLAKTLIVGENLTYADEKITSFKPDAVTNEMKFNRNVVVILDEKQ